jgi:hypothetical protein
MKKITLFFIISIFTYSIHGQVFLAQETFDTDLGTWTVTDGGAATGDTWASGAGPGTLNGSNTAFVDSDANGNGTHLIETLTSPAFDTSTGIVILLEFEQYFRASGSAIVEVWDGTTWQVVLDQTASIGAFDAPDVQSIDVTAHSNAAMQVRFIYDDLDGWNWYWLIDNVRVIEQPACSNPVATAIIVEDCANSQFSIDVDITDFGDATSLAISNDAGIAATTGITAIGVVTVGPFAISTPVILTLEHEQDAVCNVILGTFLDGCPIFSSVDCAAGTPVNTTFCYDNNEDIQYSFTSTDGSALRVDFIEGYFEDCCDDITIYDGLTTADAVLFASDGSEDNDATGITAISTGDSVLVRMVSDGSVSCASGSGSGIPLNFNVSCNTCTPANASAVVVDDCANSGGFNVVVDITDLGSAASITLSDDQGSATQNATAVGMFTFGPFTNGTDVAITVVDDADAACTEIFSGLTQSACPPANNDCANAIVLTPGAVFTDNPVVGTNAAASGSGELPLPGCAAYDPADTSGNGGDVWYAVTVPSDGNLTIETSANPIGAGGDSGMAVYSGACGALALVECDDDDSPDGFYSQVVIEPADGLADQVVYVRFWEFGGNAILNFQVSAYSATLGVDTLENEAAFTYYPNPVKNTLTLNAQNTIEQVAMYNMLGQEVLRATPNTIDSDLDMSNLQTGTYFVKVTIANVTKTIRVIKQ